MTIGEALKNCRISLQLTQTQMAAGLMSESFYSKVERGVHKIDADLLIKLLHEHGISAQSFFYLVDKKDKNLYLDVNQRMVLAANRKDLEELNKIEVELKEEDAPEWVRNNLSRLRSWVTHSNEAVSQEEKEKLKQKFFLADKWNISLVNSLQLNMYMLDFNDLEKIINTAYKKLKVAASQDELLESYLSIDAVAFINRCYHESNKKHAQSSLDFLKSTRLLPSNLYGKMLAIYYEALFDHDQAKADIIIDALKQSGYISAIQDTLEN